MLVETACRLSHLHTNDVFLKSLKRKHLTMDTDDANEMTLQVETKIGTILTDGNSDGVRIEQVGEKHYFFELPFACATSRPNSFRVRREVKRSVASEKPFSRDSCRV